MASNKSVRLPSRIHNRGCLTEWCGSTVSIKAFNLSNGSCWGGVEAIPGVLGIRLHQLSPDKHLTPAARAFRAPTLKWLREGIPKTRWCFQKTPHLWHTNPVQQQSKYSTSTRTFRNVANILPSASFPVWRVHSWTVGGTRVHIANWWLLAV